MARYSPAPCSTVWFGQIRLGRLHNAILDSVTLRNHMLHCATACRTSLKFAVVWCRTMSGSTEQGSTEWCSMALYAGPTTLQYRFARSDFFCTAWRCTGWHCTVQRSMVWLSMQHYRSLCHAMVQYALVWRGMFCIHAAQETCNCKSTSEKTVPCHFFQVHWATCFAHLWGQPKATQLNAFPAHMALLRQLLHKLRTGTEC